MRLFPVRNQTPQSSPPSSLADGGTGGGERFIWEVLAPRLLHPAKLAFIQTLLKERQPVPLSQLAKAADLTIEHAQYHCKSMERAGVLEVVSVTPRPNGDGDEPLYSFLKLPHPPPPSPAAE
jgi:hypothetical protein